MRAGTHSEGMCWLVVPPVVALCGAFGQSLWLNTAPVPFALSLHARRLA